MRRRFAGRLGLVTWDAYGLEVAVVIRAALGNVDDVVDLEFFSGQPAHPAGVVVADQDRLTLSTPWAPTTT